MLALLPRTRFRSTVPAHRRIYRTAPPPSSPEVTELLATFSHHTPRPLNLRTLLSFGDPLTPSSVLSSVQYVFDEVPRRMATRVNMLEALPFIVCSNPYIASVLHAHKDSFQRLVNYQKPQNIEENDRFAALLQDLVARHANDIPTLAKGFQECARYISSQEISTFLDSTIRNRISVRLIAEQHCAISHMLTHPQSRNIGVVDMNCSPKRMVEKCGQFVSSLCEATLGSSPSIIIDGHADATFATVPIHLEYILNEVFKNAFRASVEHHQKTYGPDTTITPVRVTLCPPPVPFAAFSERAEALPRFFAIRVRDHGGGVSLANMSRIFSYAFTTAGGESNADHEEDMGGPYAAQHIGGSAAIDGSGPGSLFGEIVGRGLQTGLGTLSGLGYGLPMSKLYASFFGGSLELLSLEGWGSDVFIKLRCLEEMGDATI